jgi:glyoxylase-like metal-dependent hydrolase (beta-lactamase superfamily II)
MITRRALLANSAIAATSALASRHLLFARQADQPASNAAATQQTLLQSMRAAAAEAKIRSTKITDTLFFLQSVGANILAFAGPDGKLLIDSGMATGTEHLLDTLTRLAPHPVKLLVNTSWLFEHTDGNAALHAAGAFIIGQENTRARLSATRSIPSFGLTLPPAPASALPQETFTDRETLYFNNDQLDLIHAPNASTNSDVFIHFNSANVIHAGELWFNDAYPFIETGSGGTINGMIQGVDRVIALADDRTKIIPSHGKPGNKTDLNAYRAMLTTVANRVEKLKISGQSLNEIIAAKITADLDDQWSHGEMPPAAFLAAVYNTL